MRLEKLTFMLNFVINTKPVIFEFKFLNSVMWEFIQNRFPKPIPTQTKSH